MEAIAQEDNLEDLMAALSELPGDLDTTYKDELQRIRNQSAQRVRRGDQILMWISFAQRPLILSELLCALAIRPGDQKIVEDRLPKEELLLSACCGLVVVDEESQIIRFVHYTMEEYIESIQQDLYPRAHEEISIILLTCLSLDSSDATTFNAEGEPVARLLSKRVKSNIYESNNYLLHYAANFLEYHTRLALETEKVNVAQDIKDMMFKFLDKKENVSTFLTIVKPPSTTTPGDVSKLHVVSILGLCSIMESLMNDEIDLEQTDSNGNTALHYAAPGSFATYHMNSTIGNEHYAIMRFLLANGANINAHNLEGRTPLGMAAFRGDDKLVVFLLDQGANINATSIDTRVPLMEAISGGEKETIRVLSEMGADMYLRDYLGGWGVLHEAIWKGDCEIVKLLLAVGADIEFTNTNGDTPLAFATRRGRLGITETLLDSGADPFAVSISGIRSNIMAYADPRVSKTLGLIIEAKEKISRQFLDQMVQI